MKTTRRTFLGGIAVVSLPVAAVASAPIETQEEKCARLAMELLDECRKLPRTRESMFGWNVDIPLPDGSHMGHSIGHDHKDYSDQLHIMIKRPGGLS